MLDIKLDKLTHDMVIQNNDLVLVSGIDEIAQAIRIHLRTYFGEWFLDNTLGVQSFGDVIGAKDPDLDIMRARIREDLINIAGVQSVDSIVVTLDGASRELRIALRVTALNQSLAVTVP